MSLSNRDSQVTSKLKQLGVEDHPAKRARLVYLVRPCTPPIPIRWRVE